MKHPRGEWSAYLCLWGFSAAGGFCAGRGLYAAAAVLLSVSALLAAGGYFSRQP